LWALRLVKRGLRPMARRDVGGVRHRAAGLRSKAYPQRFDAASLARSLGGSLRRLKREQTDIFLLHNPPAGLAASEELWRWVESEIGRGRMAAFGVSCAGSEADRAWLDHALLSVAQIPATSLVPTEGAFVADERSRRLKIMVREIVGPGWHTPQAIGDGLRQIVASQRASVAVLGMSSPDHVRDASTMFRAALQSDEQGRTV
jgi:aryl-alcohol dehydrogenase-like predicted oxidoreductase